MEFALGLVRSKGKNMGYIIFLILGIISIAISFALKKVSNETYETFQSYATVSHVEHDDYGNVRYYANVDCNGQSVEGKSIHYSKTNRKYFSGDTFPVSYYYTDNGKIMFEVCDEELVPCKSSLKSSAKFMRLAGIVLIALFFVCLIKSFI